MKFIRFSFLPLALFLTGLVFFPAAAQSGEVEATLTAPPGEYNVGDPILLTLAVSHPAGYQVILPELPADWGGLTVKSQSPLTTVVNPDGTETSTQLIDVRLFSPGEFTTPAVELTIADPAGNVAPVTAAPAAVSIGSVLVEGDTQLRDIKPQAELPYLNLLPWLAAGLLFALIGAGILLWRRRRAIRLAAAAIDRRLPNEVALDELAHILSLGLPERGAYKEYYTLLSDCIRKYMEAVYRIPVLERTTGEILASLRGLNLDPQLARKFTSILSACDLVKFSKFTPDLAEAHQTLTDARLLVEKSWRALTESSASASDGEAGPSGPPHAGREGTAHSMELTA
jgi:hypothetical protein